MIKSFIFNLTNECWINKCFDLISVTFIFNSVNRHQNFQKQETFKVNPEQNQNQNVSSGPRNDPPVHTDLQPTMVINQQNRSVCDLLLRMMRNKEAVCL